MMKNYLLAIFTVILLTACGSDSKNLMTVSGEIKGLKKGTLFLQKMKDTLLIKVDSVNLDGVNTFALSDNVESPEIYYLSLDNDDEKTVHFFGEKGEITINTKLDKFIISAEIEGLKNQQLLDEYNEMMKKFRDKNLELIKADFEAKNDTIKRDSILSISNSLVKRRYYYTTNFAVKNSDAEVAPYLALTELFNANVKLLDTINNSLTSNVKESKYGIELEKFIKKIREKNN